MARKAWMQYLPGMSPFPDGAAARMPVRRKPTRKRTIRVVVSPPEAPQEEREARDLGGGLYEIKMDRASTAAIGSLAVSLVDPREPGRPVTYDHPLALAARAGRKHALWSAPVPTFETDEERRAFEVARARKLAWRRGER